MIYCKNITQAQREWLENYEHTTSFEPMYQEDIDSGEKTFYEAARDNVGWFESWSGEALRRIDIPWELNPDSEVV